MDTKQREQVREALDQFWDENCISKKETEEVEGLIDELDSQSAIDVVLRAEKIIGEEIPEEKVIRPGGYDNKEQFIEDFFERLDRFLSSKKS